ncbi:MAG: hypothetical protein KAI66_23155 [Lentisphaeria bacterium]|nr:hypothetical protein [Lentisphaeria bacterium]
MNIEKKTIQLPLMIGAMLFAIALLVSGNAFAITEAGTDVTNSVTLTYEVGGFPQPVPSPTTVTFKVDREIKIIVNETDSTPTSVSPGQTIPYVTFTVTNDGNDVIDVALTAANVATGGATVVAGNDNFDADSDGNTGYKIYLEAGGGAGFQVGSDTLITHVDELGFATGSNEVTVYVVVDPGVLNTLTDGDVSGVTLLGDAYVSDGGAGITGTQYTTGIANYAGSTDAWVQGTEQIIFTDAAGTVSGDTAGDASHSDTDAFIVVDAIITMSKTVTTVWDPFNGTANPKAIPGAYIKYTVTIANSGSASATLTTIEDVISTMTAFDPDFSADGGPTVGPGGAGKGVRMYVTGDTGSGGARAGVDGTEIYFTNAADGDGVVTTTTPDKLTLTLNNAAILPAEGAAPNDYTLGELEPGEAIVIEYQLIIQ